MCACAGDSFAELKIEQGTDLIGTLNLILAVEQSPEDGGDPSESFIHDLEQQIYDAVADQYDADSVIFDNAPTSGHGTPYTVTSEGIKDAIDNAISGLTIPENITDLADVDVTTPTDGEILVYNNGTWENQANPASTANFGPDYDENTTYNTGDKVIYQGLFYVCNDDNVTGTWDATKWDAFTVADLNGKLLPMSTTEPNSMVADRIEALESKLPKIYYFTGTTTGNSNLDVSGTTGFDYTKETIVSVCARESQNTSYSVVCTPYTYDVANHLGYIEGLKCRSATEGRNVANIIIEGYFWTIPRGTRGN